jgi:hypothetical protein
LIGSAELVLFACSKPGRSANAPDIASPITSWAETSFSGDFGASFGASLGGCLGAS